MGEGESGKEVVLLNIVETLASLRASSGLERLIPNLTNHLRHRCRMRFPLVFSKNGGNEILPSKDGCALHRRHETYRDNACESNGVVFGCVPFRQVSSSRRKTR